MIEIKFKKLHKDAVIPKVATIGAACADVVATEIIIGEGENIGKVTVKLGFATEIPAGYKAVIVPRSSFTHKDWIVANSPCQIDSDYRGEWMLKLQAIKPYAPFPYRVGERVAQMYIEKVTDFLIKEVEELNNSERGEGGFGSTNT